MVFPSSMRQRIKRIVSGNKTNETTVITNINQDIVKTFNTSPTKSLLKEIGLFAGIFAAVFVVSMAFINANLLYHTAKDFFTGVQAENFDFSKNSVSSLMNNQSELTSFIDTMKNDDIIKQVKKDRTLFVSAKDEQQAQLASKTYNFSYSLVPPDNRILIPSIGVDAPIVDISAASENKLKQGDFNEELFQGVVKYPSTPEPGMKGNTLIFGHTSYYWWKKNPYGEIFAKIHNLNNGDTIKVAWKGQLYTYEVVDKKYVYPNDVDKEYLNYTDGEYITLMGCYPVGSDTKRSLIIAKRITPQGVTTPKAQ